MRSAQWLPLVLLITLHARNALCQPRTAEELFTQGTIARDRNDLQTALMLFRMSHRLNKKAPAVLINMAHCEELLGKLSAALIHYRQALPLLSERDEERRSMAEQRIADLGKRVARLRLDPAAGSPPQMRVELDGLALATARLGRTMPVDPGKHVVNVVALGYEGRRFNVNLTEGELLVLPITTGPAIVPSRPVPPGSESGRSSPVLGWTLLGGGVAALAVGGAFLGLTPGDLHEREEYERKFASTGYTEHASRANDASERATTKLWVGASASTAGAALIAGGIYSLWLRSRPTAGFKVALGVNGGGVIGGATIQF